MILVHIGYHKTATSWLQKHLFKHDKQGFVRVPKPELFELAYAPTFGFDPHAFRQKLGPWLEQAQAKALTPVLTWERLSGTPNRATHDTREIADRIHASFPEANILVVIREQRAAILSSYAQFIRGGGSCSLDEYIHGTGRQRSFDVRLRHFLYHQLIGYYQERFGGTRVLVLPYERFQADPEAFVAEIRSFAGLASPAPPLPFEHAVNPSLRPATLAVQRRLNPLFVRSPYNGFSPLAMRRLEPAFRASMRGLDRLLSRERHARVRQDWLRLVEATASNAIRDSNRALAKQTGLDLESLGYLCRSD